MKMKPTSDVRLEQLLDGLSADLAQSTNEELVEACADLGIKPAMKGSIAFLGLKGLFSYPYDPAKLAPFEDDDPGHGINGEDGSDHIRRE